MNFSGAVYRRMTADRALFLRYGPAIDKLSKILYEKGDVFKGFIPCKRRETSW